MAHRADSAGAGAQQAGGGVAFEVADDEPLAGVPAGAEAGGARGFTPGRRSNTRSRPHSRGKALSPLKLDPAAAGRPVSHRKERRWANDRSCGLAAGAALPSGNANAAAYDPLLEEFDVAAASRLIFLRDEDSSVFRALTAEQRRAFMDGDGDFALESLGRAANAARHDARRAMALATPEGRFQRVDRALKRHLLQTGRREPFASVLSELEALLLRELDAEEMPAASRRLEAGPALRRALLRDPELAASRTGGRPVVELFFKSGVYRLLAHGLCQFHGLASRSDNSILDDGKPSRVMRVSNAKFDPVMAGWVIQNADDAGEPLAASELVLAGEETFPLVPFLQSR
mmetsp:Transcript_11439/g.36638  ORF Transcript_11439/g.36638 Transcript_11439/m.36638 type:complete len:345 (-) Transcript_11439:827-1861(-)